MNQGECVGVAAKKVDGMGFCREGGMWRPEDMEGVVWGPDGGVDGSRDGDVGQNGGREENKDKNSGKHSKCEEPRNTPRGSMHDPVTSLSEYE